LHAECRESHAQATKMIADHDAEFDACFREWCEATGCETAQQARYHGNVKRDRDKFRGQLAEAEHELTLLRVRAEDAEDQLANVYESRTAEVKGLKGACVEQRDRAEAAEKQLTDLRKACEPLPGEHAAYGLLYHGAASPDAQDVIAHYWRRVQAALRATQAEAPRHDGNDLFEQMAMLSDRRAAKRAAETLPAGYKYASPADELRPNDRHGLVPAEPAVMLRLGEEAEPGALAKLEARLDRHEKVLRKIASATMWATNDGNAVRALLDAKAGEHG
jgi:hypothetical protein